MCYWHPLQEENELWVSCRRHLGWLFISSADKHSFIASCIIIFGGKSTANCVPVLVTGVGLMMLRKVTSCHSSMCAINGM